MCDGKRVAAPDVKWVPKLGDAPRLDDASHLGDESRAQHAPANPNPLAPSQRIFKNDGDEGATIIVENITLP